MRVRRRVRGIPHEPTELHGPGGLGRDEIVEGRRAMRRRRWRDVPPRRTAKRATGVSVSALFFPGGTEDLGRPGKTGAPKAVPGSGGSDLLQ